MSSTAGSIHASRKKDEKQTHHREHRGHGEEKSEREQATEPVRNSNDRGDLLNPIPQAGALMRWCVPAIALSNLRPCRCPVTNFTTPMNP